MSNARYTVEIIKQGAGGLDGATQLDLNAPGVTVVRSTTQTNMVTVTVPAAVALGSIDPGQLASLLNVPFVVSSVAVKSDGGPQLGSLSRLGPPSPGGGLRSVTQLVDFATTGGTGLFVVPTFFPPQQLLGITETQTGPHRIVLTLDCLTGAQLAGLISSTAINAAGVPVTGRPALVYGSTAGQDFPAASPLYFDWYEQTATTRWALLATQGQRADWIAPRSGRFTALSIRSSVGGNYLVVVDVGAGPVTAANFAAVAGVEQIVDLGGVAFAQNAVVRWALQGDGGDIINTDVVASLLMDLD